MHWHHRLVCFICILLISTAASASIMQRSSHKFFTSVITIAPAKPTATVIFMHGLGDTADGWAPMLHHEIAPLMPHIKFICPTAPVRPVTLNGGMPMTSWHDITDLRSIDTDPPTGLLESVQAVHALIDAEIKSGVPANRIMVAGFSQGAAMSLRSGFTYPQSLAGIMPLSGYLPGRVSFAIHEANAKTALRAFHGDADQVVQLDFMRLALRKLRELGATFGDAAVASSDAPLPLNVYRHMGHSSSDQEMKDMTQFLQKCLPNVGPKADL